MVNLLFPDILPQIVESCFDQSQSNVVIDRPCSRDDRKADDRENSEQRFDKAKLPMKVGGEQSHNHCRQAE
ncbi:hypothetical protein [Bradyrhizobium sp.]|jgi:hypothetical protein|uniref:hypothetical protein n=1 Tax=Bradyrhizobium sp. TaxID=376 RepID=UPI003C3D1DB6